MISTHVKSALGMCIGREGNGRVSYEFLGELSSMFWRISS